jgi:hypothetical protein
MLRILSPIFVKILLPLGLSCSLCLHMALAQNVPARINIIVVEGEGASNPVRQRVARDPVVQVEDDDHRPVAGAVVVFALPVSGASGEFFDGARNLTVLTDDNGRATARGLKTNDIPGKLQIYVTASYRGLRARSLINQMVADAPGAKTKVPEYHTAKSGGKWKWVVLSIAVAGGGAGAGYYFATHSTTSPISITTGTAAFGSPR